MRSANAAKGLHSTAQCLHLTPHAAGHETYLVGGAVRDLLLQCGAPKDWDVLTSATLHQAANLFERPALIGRRFPICALQLHNGTRVELSSMHVPPPCGYRSGSWPAVPQDAARRLSGTSEVCECVVLDGGGWR
jgi:Poly A polymerase head domain